MFDCFGMTIGEQIKYNQAMINKKLSDLFLRKQSHRKEQSKQPVCFDQSFFHCRLLSRGINTELIRLQTQVKETGQPLDQIKCKWFIKNSHDFKEIQGVTSEYYQPCLDDVGSIICVQIEPSIEGKKYTGITIMKESEVVEIDHKLEDELGEFLNSKQKKFDGRIQAVFSQNEKYESFQLPLQIKMEIKQRELFILNNGEILETISISSQYPNVQFNRKSFNSIILNFNDRESFRLSFFNNYNRDLFTLMIRTLAAHSEDINPQVSAATSQVQQLKEADDQGSEKQPEEEKQSSQNDLQKPSGEQLILQQTKIQEEKEKSQQIIAQTKVESSNSLGELPVENSPVKTPQKSEESKQTNTLLILKMDEQNKQLKSLKRHYQQLKVNYNIQKQSKKKLQNECEEHKKKFDQISKKYQEARKICSRMDKVYQDNRFYKNELSIMKKQMKSLKQKIVLLQNKAKDKANEQSNQYEQKIKKAIEEKGVIENINYTIQKAREQAQNEVQRLKQQLQRIQNDNQTLKKKLESLQSEKKVSNIQSTTYKSQNNQNDTRVQDLQMKLKNLEMLLRYKSNQGDVSSNLQLLVNKLTQTISEKQIQMNQVKKINKNLLMQLKELKESKGK